MVSPRRLRIRTAITVVKALVARAMFIVHMLFAIWAASCVAGNKAVWSLMAVLGLFVIETIYSIVKRKGQEPKWFSPCIFLYLLTVVPPIWILNLDMFQCFASTQLNKNGTCTGLSGHTQTCAFTSFETYFDRKPLAYTLEEIMLLLLILGRWMLPKGNVSREQLSQLLLVYFGISFDIMELFYLFDEPYIVLNSRMYYVILSVWSFCLFQFTIVLTVVKSKRPRLSLQGTPLKCLTSCRCCKFEIWGLLTMVIMQDGPFLVLRLYCLIGLKLFSYNLLFYTIKNIVIVILQGYRIAVLLLNCREDFDSKLDVTASMVSITRVTRNGVPETPARERPPLTGYAPPTLSRTTSVNTIGKDRDFSFESAV